MTRILTHVRHNVIAYLALFIALGGTGYAAITIPNGSITAAKLNKRSIGGYVLAWAHVRSDGHVLSGSRGARAVFLKELTGETPSTPNYIVGWLGMKIPSHCAAIVTVDDLGPLSSRGSGAEANIHGHTGFVGAKKTRGQVMVDVANSTGQNVPDNFYAAVVC
jgi:hypothetical protein